MWDTPERVSFGLWAERELKPSLEKELGVPLTKTVDEFDLVDFEGPDGIVVELKARRQRDYKGELQTHGRFYSWLFPTHKEPPLRRAKRGVLFYYWVADDTLWRLDYNPEWAAEVDRDVPEWHRTYQEHWYIPWRLWSPVERLPGPVAEGPTGASTAAAPA